MNKVFFIKAFFIVGSFFCCSLSAEQILEINEKTQKQKELDVFFEKKSLQKISSSAESFLELGLEYPMNFGVHLRYPIENSLYARFGFGFMPRFFLDSFEKLSPSLGYLNEEEARLLSETFENSIYVDLRLSWLPYLKKFGGGPYLEIGFSGIFYGNGKLKGSYLSKTITGTEFDELTTYSAKTNAYNATIHAGYQIPFEKLKLNIEVGLIKILHSNVLSIIDSLKAPKLLSPTQEEHFKTFLKKKGWIFPTISGWISFSF